MQRCEIDEKSNALPRDISRFKRLYPNGRAVIREDADTTLAFLSTAELVLDKTRH
ncbi:hypothetical protein [Aquamicrobium soli]|uniref:Uncharacterized protein n=1 Tax=Aquamicrobium soli TaxID=1811518 RepID=A0ABV7KCG2_9HYPH